MSLSDALNKINAGLTIDENDIPDHHEFSELDEFLKQESEDDAQKQEQRRIKAMLEAGITERYFEATWNNWIADTPDKTKAKENAKLAWDKNLFLTGNNGTGKTHLAMCLTKEGATYARLPDIFREVKINFDDENKILNHYGTRKLLILDEVGRQKCSDFEVNLVFEILDRRWNNVLPTTLITNLSVQEFADIYNTAILDRLRPTVVNFNWESMR
jgi:DNA replication protein DnaC